MIINVHVWIIKRASDPDKQYEVALMSVPASEYGIDCTEGGGRGEEGEVKAASILHQSTCTMIGQLCGGGRGF